MASLFGHAAAVVGFQKLFPQKKIGKKALFLGVVSSILPDIDVISERFGVISGSSFDFIAHRGLTHSIVFALIWAVTLVYLFHRPEKTYYKILFSFYFLCTMSHGVLDAMTNGGDGIAFLMPVSDERFFFPWRMIEVSPLGISNFFSKWGVEVLISEFKYIGIPALLLYAVGLVLNKSVYK